MTRKEARGCISRTVATYTMTDKNTGEMVTKGRPFTRRELNNAVDGKMEMVTKTYALPMEKFMELAEEVED